MISENQDRGTLSNLGSLPRSDIDIPTISKSFRSLGLPCLSCSVRTRAGKDNLRPLSEPQQRSWYSGNRTRMYLRPNRHGGLEIREDVSGCYPITSCVNFKSVTVVCEPAQILASVNCKNHHPTSLAVDMFINPSRFAMGAD